MKLLALMGCLFFGIGALTTVRASEPISAMAGLTILTFGIVIVCTAALLGLIGLAFA